MDPATGTLASIDYLIIMVYMLGVLGIGTFFGRYVRSAGDFYLGGRALPFWAVGMSIVVSDIGAIDLVSGAGGAFQYGIAQANFDWIGSMPAMVIAALMSSVDSYLSSSTTVFVSFWSFLFSLAVTATASFVTPPEPTEKIRGLVFHQVLHDEEAQRLLRRRVDRSST